MKTKTKKEYQEYLNEIGISMSEECFIIAGKFRKMQFGDALRKYDPIAFNVSFNEHKRK